MHIVFGVATGTLGAQEPVWDGDSLAYWIARLHAPRPGDPTPEWFAARDAALDRLVNGAPDSLSMLGHLLQSSEMSVVEHAAVACRRLGRSAAPLLPPLVLQLSSTKSRVVTRAATAVAGIGLATPEVLAALVHGVCSSPSSTVRYASTRALSSLDPDAARKLLAKVETGAFQDAEVAIEALAQLGPSAVDGLIESASRADATADVARAALVRIGWRSVDRIERAGQFELAQVVLREGALIGVLGMDYYELADSAVVPPLAIVPTIEWEFADRGGPGIRLFRAADGAAGMDVVELQLQRESATEPERVLVRTTVLPRRHVLAAARQLAVLEGLSIRRVRRNGGSMSTQTFHAQVRVSNAEQILLDARFCGSPNDQNTSERFRAEAGSAVLRVMVADASWTTRAATDDERDWVAARAQRCDDDPGWVKMRFLAMAAALTPR
jgi:hypothetical protein